MNGKEINYLWQCKIQMPQTELEYFINNYQLNKLWIDDNNLQIFIAKRNKGSVKVVKYTET